MTSQITLEEQKAVPAVLTSISAKSLVNTFEKMFGISCNEVNKPDGDDLEGIVGLISFVGDYTWSLALRFPQHTAEHIAFKFAGFEIEFDSADMGDVIGELTNVLAGVVSGELESAGVHSQMSLPTVARGSHVELLLGENLISEKVLFSTDGGCFWMVLIVAKQKH